VPKYYCSLTIVKRIRLAEARIPYHLIIGKPVNFRNTILTITSISIDNNRVYSIYCSSNHDFYFALPFSTVPPSPLERAGVSQNNHDFYFVAIEKPRPGKSQLELHQKNVLFRLLKNNNKFGERYCFYMP